MSCRSFEDLVTALSREGTRELDAATRASALAHASECERCASRLREERRLSRALDGLALANADLEAPPYVEAALLGAFRAHATAASRTRRDARRASWTWGLAAAVVIGLAAGVAGWWPRSTGGERAATAAVPASLPEKAIPPADGSKAAAVPPSEDASAFVAPPRAHPAPGARAKPVASAVRRGDAWKRAARTESDRPQYVPWLWADPTTDFDRGHVVRVGLPRAALASWGWPLEGDVADEAVEAELLLGEDGVARAIRVVR
jgi:hypothetical protein